MSRQLAVGLGMALCLYGTAEARTGCRQDADCSPGGKCQAPIGLCGELSAMASTGRDRQAVSGSKPPRPERFDHGWTRFGCVPGVAGYLAITYVWQGQAEAPKLVLDFALTVEEFARASSGATVQVDVAHPLPARLYEVAPGCDPSSGNECPAIRTRDAEIDLLTFAFTSQQGDSASAAAEINLRLKQMRSSFAGLLQPGVTVAALRTHDLNCRQAAAGH
jgi:hypothetical protein